MKNNLRYVVGADIGGSHITAAVVDVEKRELLADTYVRQHLDTDASLEEIITCWTTVLQRSMRLSGVNVTYIGLALPGPFEYDIGICLMKNQGKYDQLYGVNIKEKLAESLKLPMDHILLDNDAACFLKGEIFVGNAEKKANVLGLTLGTGLGSVVSTTDGVRDAELWCSSYKEGIAEDYFSTRWFVSKYLHLTGVLAKNVRQICEDAPKAVVDLIFKEFADNLKEFLQLQIATFHPDKIIIGGNIGKASEHFMPVLNELPVPVVITVSGEDATLLGAASSFLETHGERSIF